MSALRVSRVDLTSPPVVGVIGAAALFVAVADPWLTVATAVVATAVWLGWSRPALGLGAVAATIPVQEGLQILVGPVTLTATQIVLLPLLAGWFAAWILNRAVLPVTATIVVWGIVTAALALSVVTAVDQGDWAREVYRWMVALLLYAVAGSAMRRFADAKPLLGGVAIGVLFCAAIAFWQVATGTGPPTYEAGGLMRAYGLFGSPNPLAAYLEMAVLLMAPVGLMLASRRDGSWLHRYGLLAVGVIGATTLVLTQSRGGLLGFAAGAAVIAWCFSPGTRRLLLIAILVAIPTVTLTPVGRSGTERFVASVADFNVNEQTTPANWSIHERVAHWRAGLRMLDAEPWTGVGAGNFNDRYREMTSVWRFRIPRGHAHNSVIQVGAQAGYVGLIAYLALFFTAGARIARGVRSARDCDERALALGGLGVLIAVAVHGQFDYLHGLSLNLAFVLALAAAEPALRSASSADRTAGAAR